MENQLNNLQEQMKALAGNVKIPTELITQVQNDVKAIKEQPSS